MNGTMLVRDWSSVKIDSLIIIDVALCVDMNVFIWQLYQVFWTINKVEVLYKKMFPVGSVVFWFVEL